MIALDLTNTSFFLCALALFFAYFIRGIAGFGSALIAMPILTMFVDFSLAVPLMCILDYFASFKQAYTSRRMIEFKEIWGLVPFSLVGVFTGTYFLQNISTRLLGLGLGVFVLSFAIYSLLDIKFKKGSKKYMIPCGFMGGCVGAVFSTGGPFYVIYLKLRQLDKARFRATISFIFIIDGFFRIASFIFTGIFSLTHLFCFMLGIPILLTGLFLGQKVHLNISQQGFTRLVSFILLASGCILIIKNL